MIVNNRAEAHDYIVSSNPNGTEERWLNHVVDRIRDYPVHISYCSDERTGHRFGLAKCRRDLNPMKIGGGGRNRGSYAAYQLWVWDT